MPRTERTGARYHSPLRAQQAAQTREHVLSAATRLFAERGWTGTTLSAIAQEAGLAVETIYAGFGSKLGLLAAAIDVAVVGDDAPVPLAQRPEYALMGMGSRRERLAEATSMVVRAHHRSVPLVRALHQAAAADAGAAERWARYEHDRRIEIARALALILERTPDERTIDALWVIAGSEVYAKLVLDCGWQPEEYRRWLTATVDRLLLAEAE